MAVSTRARFEVFKRDGFRCRYCGVSADAGAVLHVDHIRPRKLGGSDEMANLATACRRCNLGKSAVELADAAKLDKDDRILAKRIGSAIADAHWNRILRTPDPITGRSIWDEESDGDHSAWLEDAFPLGLPEGFM